MSDIVEQAEQVIIDHTSDDVSYGELAQALADAGLLRDPARTVPTREQIEIAVGGVLFNASNHPDPGAILGKSIAPLRDKITDAILALLADQPTVAEAKAQVLEEAADAFDALQTQMNEHPSRRDPAVWLIDRAQQIRDGK